MQSGDFRGAEAELRELLQSDPDDQDGLYSFAVCMRKLQQHEQAESALVRLLNHSPRYGHAHQERGFLLQSMGSSDRALSCFETAIEINPALHASWRELAKAENYHRYDEAFRMSAWLSNLPPHLVSVASYIHQDKLETADLLCRQFLRKHNHHPEAMRLLAEIANKYQVLDDAEFLLESCLEFHPDYHPARLDYVAILYRRQKFKAALEQAERLIEIDRENVSFKLALANAQQGVGDFENAVRSYEEITEQNPQNHMVQLALGHALKTIGQTDKAITAYRKSQTARTGFGDAYWSMANLKTYEFTDAEMEQMNAKVCADHTETLDRIHLSFALGKAYEDRGAFETSFEHYARGNQLKFEQGLYRKDQIVHELGYQAEHFDAEFFGQRADYGSSSAEPIFIVGLPRAGSTLLEQILASHSQVDGTMELGNVVSLAHKLNAKQAASDEPMYPAVLNKLDEKACTEFGEEYVSETMSHRSGAPYFIDKMPNNFLHIALIHLILPNAKIIDARRDPMACGFSCFKQFFAEGQEFSYDLSAIADYYQRYVRIMDHWEKVLPGRILRVQHEDVIENLECEVRRILDYCNLPFEQACVDYHKTERAVRTPSSEQVRQPIFTSSMQQWRHYEAHLEPLLQAFT